MTMTPFNVKHWYVN